MASTPSLCLLTPTWSGDRQHFDVLSASLARSALAELPHFAVVQSEDMDAFAGSGGPSTRLVPSSDILPSGVDRRRQQARRWASALGRAGTRLSGSLALRTGGWPSWVHYTGWHTQQITKLAFAAQSDFDTVVVMDSDVVVLPHASTSDFVSENARALCYQADQPASAFGGKRGNWNRQAHALLDVPYDPQNYFDTSFETPFVLHTESLRALMRWLEKRYDQPWWQVLLAQPVRRWSEFATYRLFLKRHMPTDAVEWRSDALIRYLFDAADPEAVGREVRALTQDPAAHFVTIHSQSSGRQLWGAEGYAPHVMDALEAATAASG
ncbi:DUF6492 family protein [Algiphilus sp.]|uniref:DUF6492 family protein n=1 Tax=Algiphilus sp. TaxID=1872431 RepID=UPI003B52502E